MTALTWRFITIFNKCIRQWISFSQLNWWEVILIKNLHYVNIDAIFRFQFLQNSPLSFSSNLNDYNNLACWNDTVHVHVRGPD